MQWPANSPWPRVLTPVALALVSLLAAIVLWVAVTDAENPNRVGFFPGGLPVQAVNVADGLSVFSIRDATVSVRISAPDDVFRKLTTANFRAEVDMAGVRDTSQQVVSVRVIGEQDVEVIEVSPGLVTVTMEPTSSKIVPVIANPVGAPPQGFSIDAQSGIAPSPPSVKVTGATSLVSLVTNASADVNLTGLRTSLEQQYPLVARDSRGGDISGVHLDPTNASIKVNVSQQEVTLALTIVPPPQGTVADGYNLVGITPDPPALPVSGPLEVLNALQFIATEPIDVSGLRADATRTVRLRLPAGLQTTRDSVIVRLKVVPAPGEIAITIVPQVTGNNDALKATLQTASVTVRVSGELPSLRTMAPNSVRATVNASGLEEGVHVLRPTITAPEGTQVVSANPSQVVIVLSK